MLNTIFLLITTGLVFGSSFLLCLRFGSDKFGEVFFQTLLLTIGAIHIAVFSISLFGPYLTRFSLFFIMACYAVLAFYFCRNSVSLRLLSLLRRLNNLKVCEYSQILLFFIAIFYYVIDALLFSDETSDGLGYHSSPPIAWSQGNSILADSIDYGRAALYYPKSIEVLIFWMSYLAKNWYLADFGNLLPNILACSSIYVLGRYYTGLSRLQSLISVNLFTYTPLVIAQTPSLLTDISFAGFFWSTLTSFLINLYSPDLFSSCIIGVSSGLFIGAKYQGLPFFVLLCSTFLSIIIKRNYGRWDWTKILHNSSIAAVMAFLCGGFWYCINFIKTGNPIEPFEITLLGCKILSSKHPWVLGPLIDVHLPVKVPGKFFSYYYSTLHSLLDLGPRAWDPIGIDGGFGPVFLCLAFPTLLFPFFTKWRSKIHFFNFILILLIISVAYAIQPSRWWSRYVLWVTLPAYISLPIFLFSFRCRLRNIMILGLSLANIIVLLIHPAMSDLKYKVKPRRIIKQIEQGDRSVYGKRYGIPMRASVYDWIYDHACGKNLKILMLSGSFGSLVCSDFDGTIMGCNNIDDPELFLDVIEKEIDFIVIDEKFFNFFQVNQLDVFYKNNLIEQIPYYDSFIGQMVIKVNKFNENDLCE